ncbi:MAG: hypothetical protein ABID64_00190 [Nitrospirota bacterium]
MNIIKKYFHQLILVLLIFVVLLITYYLLYTLPNFHREQLELQKQEVEAREKDSLVELEAQNEAKQARQQKTIKLNECLEEAEWRYGELQEFLFQKAEEPDCRNNFACMTVNAESRDEIKLDLSDEKDECFKLYSN